MIDQMRGEIARRKMLSDFTHPTRASVAADEKGLAKAYADPDTGTWYDPQTRTLNIRGTSNMQDWKDDFTKIPAWGESRDIEMYKNASRAYDKLISEGKPVDRVTGHSLGGSMALQLQQDRDIPFSRTFGAPVWDLGLNHKGLAHRFRHPMDPISVFDREATWGNLRAYPHMAGGYKETFDEKAQYLPGLDVKGQTSFAV